MKWSTLEHGERLVLIGVLAALTGLLTWPVFVQRDAVRQVEFAWEMYAKLAPSQSFTVVTPPSSIRVDLDEVVALGVAEIPYEEVVPDWLCRHYLAAERIVVHFGADVWEHVCDR